MIGLTSFHLGYNVISNAVMFFMQSLNDVPVVHLGGFILRVKVGVRKKSMRYQLGGKLFLFSGLPNDFLGCHSLDLLPQGCWYLFAFCLVVGGCSLWSVVTRAVAPQERWQDNQFDCRPSWPGLPPYPSRHCPLCTVGLG